jgi:hypothetical protein
MLASTIHLWATIRGISFPVTNSLSVEKQRTLCGTFSIFLVSCDELSKFKPSLDQLPKYLVSAVHQILALLSHAITF